MSYGIIIPMYNEEKGVAKCVDAVMAEIRSLNMPVKLIAVNDGSRDNTQIILESKLKQFKNDLIIVNNKKNKGYGGAIREGIKRAEQMKLGYILIMDSDLTNDPKYIKEFIIQARLGYDCIKASRYIKGGKAEGVPAYRKIISIIGNKIASLLFATGVKDCTNGFCMIKLEKLHGVILKENGFSIILEMMYHLKKRHAQFKEIPYTLTTRVGNGKSHFKYNVKTFYNYLKYPVKSFF